MVGYVPEEMGHISPPEDDQNAKVPLEVEEGRGAQSPNGSRNSGSHGSSGAGRIPGGRGDKMSFVGTASDYR